VLVIEIKTNACFLPLLRHHHHRQLGLFFLFFLTLYAVDFSGTHPEVYFLTTAIIQTQDAGGGPPMMGDSAMGGMCM